MHMALMQSVNTSYYESPIGLIEIQSIDNKLCSILFIDKKQDCPTSPYSSINTMCVKQLEEYFSGTRLVFDLPYIQDGTEFQQKVWNELLSIPYGSTLSYGQLAKQLGDEKSVRAVGSSNGKNKLLIILPCHRVIASNGSLTGYAGELWRKEWLLKHEINYSAPAEGRLF